LGKYVTACAIYQQLGRILSSAFSWPGAVLP
jgi:hypothetical protein